MDKLNELIKDIELSICNKEEVNKKELYLKLREIRVELIKRFILKL